MSCPAGYTQYTTVFHQSQCLLPENALKYFFIELTILCSVFVTLCLLRIRRAKGDARDLLAVSIVAQLSLIVDALSLYVQGGSYEGAIVTAILFVMCTSYVGGILLKLALSPGLALGVDMATTHKLLSFWRRFAVLANICLAGIGVAQMVQCRRSDAEFNVGQVVFWFGIALYVLCLPTGCYYYLAKLERVIRATEQKAPTTLVAPPREKLSDFARKLYLLRIQIGVFTLCNSIAFSSVLTVFLVLGYFPYAWVVLILVLHSCAMVTLGVLVLLRSTGKSGSSSRTAAPKSVPSGTVDHGVLANEDASIAQSSHRSEA
jgi:hypothetical protein